MLITQEDLESFARYARYFYNIKSSYPDLQVTAYFDKINGNPVMVMNKRELGLDKIFIVGQSASGDKQTLALISEIKAMITNGTNRCFIENYRTSYGYQNQGYGSYLMNIVKHASKEKGHSEIYGQIDPYDDIKQIPEHLLEKTGFDEYAAAKLYLKQHYSNQGFEIENIRTPHTNRKTGEITYSNYLRFFGDPQQMHTTQTYPDGFFDMEQNNQQIINYDEILYGPVMQRAQNAPLPEDN